MSSSKIKIVPKGWGYEKWIVNTEEYCGKLLHLIKGKKCSWHYHTLKDETFYAITQSQLDRWGCKYHDLILGKPSGDHYIDDKGISADEFFKN